MRRFLFGLGVGVGYVLGAHAGRNRYEQIVSVTRRVADRPGVRLAAGVVTAKAGGLLRPGSRAAG